jgi:hypothetical protein
MAEAIRDGSAQRAMHVSDGAGHPRNFIWLEPSVVLKVSFSEVMQGRLRGAVLRAAWAATKGMD